MAGKARPRVSGQVESLPCSALDADAPQGVYRSMKQEQLESFLASVPVEAGDDGWSQAPAERNITLYAAHGGVPLTVSKVDAVKLDGELVWARTPKGGTYQLLLDDLFALAVDAPQNAERKAGFAADR